VAVGGRDKAALRRLWCDLLGLPVTGSFRSERENVDEDIAVAGAAPFSVEVDLMQPIDPDKQAARARPGAQPPRPVGRRPRPPRSPGSASRACASRPGGVRRGAAGHDVCFIHPKGDAASPQGGEGVLIELVQAPPDVIAAYDRGAR
jgi:lactoylglutathione lyase